MRKARGSVPATFRENVFGVAAGDVEPPCDGADGRSRGLAPPQCVEDDVGLLFGARISAKRHECTARRPRPPGRLPLPIEPVFLPFTTARRSACDLPFGPMFLLALMRFQSRPLSSARRARSQRFPPLPTPLCLLILASSPFLVPRRSDCPSILISSCKLD